MRPPAVPIRATRHLRAALRAASRRSPSSSASTARGSWSAHVVCDLTQRIRVTIGLPVSGSTVSGSTTLRAVALDGRESGEVRLALGDQAQPVLVVAVRGDEDDRRAAFQNAIEFAIRRYASVEGARFRWPTIATRVLLAGASKNARAPGGRADPCRRRVRVERRHDGVDDDEPRRALTDEGVHLSRSRGSPNERGIPRLQPRSRGCGSGPRRGLRCVAAEPPRRCPRTRRRSCPRVPPRPTLPPRSRQHGRLA